MALAPFVWKDKPALIEHIFPVQKVSAESYKEQSAVQSKTLTALGSYWKGRKPLVLNKACILGSLLPITADALKDLEIFEMLMGMDTGSMNKRLAATLPASRKDTVGELLLLPFSEQVRKARRAEELGDDLYTHIWDLVNQHLGTAAQSFPELIEQMGIARFGRRPKVADVFCGSGQIPFEAARLGCDVYASDLNPIACMLTWGAFNIVGATKKRRKELACSQQKLVQQVQKKIDELKIEKDGAGWTAKAFLYCVEVKCPQTGWMVPVIPSLIVSASKFIVVKLVPIVKEKKYEIAVYQCKNKAEMANLSLGTFQDGHVVHSPDGVNQIRINIQTIRGDYREGRENKNRLRLWEKLDFMPWHEDIFQERLYCVQWMRKKATGSQYDYEFRSITKDDLMREQKVEAYVRDHLVEWQDKGYVPGMVIEAGEKTDEPIRTRGWTHWHHLFSPRQILMLGLVRGEILKTDADRAALELFFARLLDWSTKLCRYGTGAARESIAQTFYNQALNTFYNYGIRPFSFASTYLLGKTYNFPVSTNTVVNAHPAEELGMENDIYVTDPPYGDAVKYEEITEFFIAWLRKNPSREFAHWIWDSRRSLAIKGEDEGFRQGMVASYRKMAEKMPDNGIQILMFTHQSGVIWADMANIIWASGLQVTAAWYVVTETDAAIRKGASVQGTVILVLRKRLARLETFRDDLGWEIEGEVKTQVESLMGLDTEVRIQSAEGLYTDADLQMAGYAAALKVLTAYSCIDGKDMVTEAEAPRRQGQENFVEELINFAVQTANQFLIPLGFEKEEWQKLQASERFYLKMIEMEYQGAKTLDNYQNFAKAFKVHHYDQLMSDTSRANAARLKLSTELRGSLMSGNSEIAGTPLRAVLYALFELSQNIEVDEVLLHLMDNCPNFLSNKSLIIKISDYIVEKREGLKVTRTFNPAREASCARVLAESLRNQRL